MVKDFCTLCNNKINEYFSLVVERENRIEIIEGVIKLVFTGNRIIISTSKLRHPFVVKASDLSISYMDEANIFYCELKDNKNNITYTVKQKRDSEFENLETNEVIVNVNSDGFTLVHYNILCPELTKEDDIIYITSEETDDTCSFYLKDIEQKYLNKETEEIEYIRVKTKNDVVEIFFIN